MTEQPRKGTGKYRHCYLGQEANLEKALADYVWPDGRKGMSWDEFNERWDYIEARNRDHELSEDEKNTEYRQEIARRISRQFKDACMNSDEDEPFNLFVPTFAPRYQEMVDLGGKPGISLEDNTRHGVWVRRSWYRK